MCSFPFPFSLFFSLPFLHFLYSLLSSSPFSTSSFIPTSLSQPRLRGLTFRWQLVRWLHLSMLLQSCHLVSDMSYQRTGLLAKRPGTGGKLELVAETRGVSYMSNVVQNSAAMFCCHINVFGKSCILSAWIECYLLTCTDCSISQSIRKFLT